MTDCGDLEGQYLLACVLLADQYTYAYSFGNAQVARCECIEH